MTPLQQAAQELLDRWDSTYWKDQRATSEYVNALRVALEAEQAQAASCGYDETVGLCTSNPCCYQAAPVQKEQAVETATGERAELIHWLRERSMWDGMLRLIDAANMLEADAKFKPDWVGYRQGVEDGKAEAQQVAVPMAEDEIEAACRFIEPSLDGPIAYDLLIARAIEAYHGIGAKP